MAIQGTPDLAATVAAELALPRARVERTLALFAGGATVPFIARYRKEATGGLDEVTIGQIQERHEHQVQLEARRKTILDSIAAQGKLTGDLRARILATRSKTELEDLYLPYKPKRRTRATIARERGLEPLADLVWAQTMRLEKPREALARPFVDAAKGVPDVGAAWQGARDIVAERIAEDADVRASLRDLALAEGRLASRVAKGKEQEGKKFEDYHAFEGPARTLPGHRVLAVFRGENEGFLKVSLAVDEEDALARIRRRVVRERRAALAADLEAALLDAWRRLLGPSTETDVRATLQERADAEAIHVFAENLRHLLLQPPLGGKRVLAIDPGFRTGCKVVALDEQGDLVAETVIYPHEPQKRAAEAKQALAAFAGRHRIEAVAVGNGTAGRETLELVRAMKRETAARGSVRGRARERERRLRVLGLRDRARGVPGQGHHRARGRVDRAAPSRSARRAGEDRPQVDRGRPVPARREPACPQAIARRGRRVVREQGRCRCEHRLGEAPLLRVGDRRDPGQEHRLLPRRARPASLAPTTS